MSQYKVEKSIRIKAEPIEVWRALTDPEKTKKYFYHSRVLSDWQPGSTITFKGKMFYIIPFEMTGKILQVQPAKFLQYTIKNGKTNDTQKGYSKVTDILTYENGWTKLEIIDDVGDAPGAEERMEKSEKGWDKVLHGLKKVVEEG